ncbi:hypothetical protein FKM82_027175 [Ascaphus truei]
MWQCSFTSLVMLYVAAGPVWGDSVDQPRSETGREKEEKTLTCTYKSSGSYPCLFWYRQHPSSALQYILRDAGSSGACNSNKANFTGRFNAKTDSSSTKLTISSLELGDAAVYFCAVTDFPQ